jgi:hypothetical protein
MDRAEFLRSEAERMLETSRALEAAALAGDWLAVAELEVSRGPGLEAMLAGIAEAAEDLDAETLTHVHRCLRAVLASDQVTAQAVATGRARLGEELRALGRGGRMAQRYRLSLVSTQD